MLSVFVTAFVLHQQSKSIQRGFLRFSELGALPVQIQAPTFCQASQHRTSDPHLV